ncbi:MAG: hypothetical protein SVU32_09635 [Candidatus Nanohaloarchaea archaeon]|nr:hypothetical protein [Candidatus Nanohaloarchaea archaeon]
MRRYILPALLLVAVTANAAAVGGQASPVTIDVAERRNATTVFVDKNVVQFPAARSGDEVVRYENVSMEEYASWQLAEAGRSEVLALIDERVPSLQDGTLQSGLAAGTITITFVRNRSASDVSFGDVVDATPAYVNGTVRINGYPVTARARVNVTAIEAQEVGWGASTERRAYGKGTPGHPVEGYNTSFKVVGTVQGRHTGDRVTNVTAAPGSISFTGYFEVPTPCHTLQPSFEERNGTLYVTVSSSPGEQLCTQQVATHRYRFQVEGTAPFTVAISHGNRSIRAIRTARTVAEPSSGQGFMELLLEAIRSILPF